MSLERGEIAIFGNGPAGLSSAFHLLEKGYRVDVFRPEANTSPRSIYSTIAGDGKVMERFLSPEHRKILPFIRAITARGSDFTVSTGATPYFMVDNLAFIESLEQEVKNYKGSRITKLPQYILNQIVVHDRKNGAIVIVDGEQKTYDVVLDCTGVDAKIAKQTEPSRENENFFVEWIYGATFQGSINPEAMTIVIGPAGGNSWVSPSITPGHIDVVYSAYGPNKESRRFFKSAKKRLQILLDFVKTQPGIEVYSTKPQDVYYGKIRSQPTPMPQSNRLICIGESAGMAKPGSGDSWRRAIMAGKLAAQSIDSGAGPQDFYRTWRNIWKDRIIFAAFLARSEEQTTERGTTIDRFYSWIKTGKNVDSLVKDIEDYIVLNRLNRTVLLRFLMDPVTRKNAFKILLKQIEITRSNNNLSIPWGLAEV